MTKKSNNNFEELMEKVSSNVMKKFYLKNPVEDKPDVRVNYYIETSKTGKLYNVVCLNYKIKPFHAMDWEKKRLEKNAPSIIIQMSKFYPEQYFDNDTIEELKKQCLRFVSAHGLKPIEKEGYTTKWVGADGVKPNDYVHRYIERLIAI